MRLVRAGQLRAEGARRGERGAALVEFSIVALVFLTATFGVLEFSRLLWTHNALSDAARRGARYAVTHPSAEEAQVKNVVVYGNEAGEGRALATGLTPEKVSVEYVNSPVTGVFGYPEGSVTVSIEGYDFNFILSFVGASFTMPDYRTTLPAESAGIIPPDVTPTPTPTASPSPTPTATPPPATPTPTPPPPTPTPSATPTPPPPTPTPAPTPPSCARGQNVSTGCACRPPLRVNGAGKCN